MAPCGRTGKPWYLPYWCQKKPKAGGSKHLGQVVRKTPAEIIANGYNSIEKPIGQLE
jgi:hypothetical protein